MTIDVFAPTYESAAAALLGVNHDAASLFITLKGCLNGSGSMAGDDATSTEFSVAYDTQAQAAVDALRDLVDASGNLAVLTATSIENHRKSDAAAVYTAPPLLFDGCQITASTGELDVAAYDVPASEGGDGGDLPAFFDVIIDHVQGVVWPNADTDTLRRTATGWRTAATSLDELDNGCRTAITHLEDQRAPEIPLAVVALTNLRTSASELADACRSLGTACDEHADEVDDRRDEIRGILKDLAIEAGAALGVGFALSFFTAGLTGAAASTAVGMRAAAYGVRIVGVLDKLRAAVRVGAIARLTTAGSRVRGVGPVLKRLANRTARGGRRPPALPRRSPDEILRSLPKGKSGDVRLVRSEAELRRLWDELRRDGTLIPGRANRRFEAWYRLPDGTEVGLRPTSRTGGPTIDLFPPDSRAKKVHIDD